MKRILILLALACASAMQLRAQFFHNTYKELSSAPRAQLINTEEIQGHDDLDSLCYLRAYTFRMPYSSKSDKNKIDKLIERIQSQFESASKNLNSYCSIAPLNNGCQIKSRRVAHFFKKDEQEFIIGGPGRCYMSMRCQDTGNPSYRTAEGMEWWLYKEGGKEEVRFKVFILHGLMGKSLSNTLSINFASSYTVFDTNIKILQKLTHWSDLWKEAQELLSVNINKYLINTLQLKLDASQYVTLFHTFNDVPGYYACIIRNQRDKEYMPLSKLANIYPKLNVFCVTWTEHGDAECRKKAEETSSPCYFMLQVYLDD